MSDMTLSSISLGSDDKNNSVENRLMKEMLQIQMDKTLSSREVFHEGEMWELIDI